MANRTIELSLKANVTGLVNGVRTARDAASNAGRDLDNFRRQNEQAWNTVGTTLTAAGTAATAGVGMVTKAAIDWESAWAGVQKTNEGTSQQMQLLEDDLRELATTLPATHQEIAGVAEAAGQLGVGVDNVSEFTETMINLGETTNLSAEEAATGLARFSNITGTSFADVDKLGSAVVGLGNNFATTESEILEMSERIAAAGTQAGLSEGEILGLSTAMSSVGIRAEAGGTAMTMTFNEIDKAVRGSGEEVEGWAELAGVSAQEFSEAWQNDPATAIDMVVTGLGQVSETGGDVNGTLEDLGIKGVRQADTLRRLASASDLVGDSFAMGNEEFEKNSALTEEAALRYETAEAKIATAWNNIKDAAITAGEVMLPAVGGIADAVGGIADAFSNLPPAVSGSITVMSGIAGVASLATGGLMLLAPRAVETYDAFNRIAPAGSKARTAIRRVGKAAGITSAALIGLQVIGSIQDGFSEGAVSVDEFSQALLDVAEGGQALQEVDFAPNFSIAYQDIDSLGEALERVNSGGFQGFMDGIDRVGNNMLGLNTQITDIDNNLANLDTAMSDALSSGDIDRASEGFRNAVEQGKEFGLTVGEVAESFPQYMDGLRSMAEEQGVTLEGTDLLEAAMGNLPPAMQDTKDAADNAAQQDQLQGALEDVGVAADGAVESLGDYLEMLFETGLAEQSAMQAQASYQESLAGVGDAVDQITDPESGLGGMAKVLNEAGDGFNVTTEAGRIAQGAFLGVSQSGMDMAQAMAEAGDSQGEIQTSLEGTYEDLISTAGEFGITGEAAEGLARSVLGVPEGVSIESWMSETAQQTADELGGSLDAIPDGLTVIATMSTSAREEAWATADAIDLIPKHEKVDVAVSENGTAGQVQSSIDSVTGKTEYVFVQDDGTTSTVQQQIVNIDGVNRTVYVDDNGTIYATKSEIQAMPDGDSTIWADADTSSAERSLNHAARDRYSTVRQSVTRTVSTFQGLNMPGGGATGGVVGRDFGLPRLASGGRLPYTGLGTDQIMGIGRHGMPTAMVDDGEWVTREPMSRKYNGVLDRINADHPSVQHLAGYANGGSVGREWSAASMSMSAPNVHVAAPNVDTSGIREEVQAGLAGATIQFNMNGRTFTGMVVDAQKQAKSMGAR